MNNTRTKFTMLVPVKIEIGRDFHNKHGMKVVTRILKDDLQVKVDSGYLDFRLSLKVDTSKINMPSVWSAMHSTRLPDLQKSVLDEAVKWFKSNKPLAWSDAEHLDNPTVNCPDAQATLLAIAVAKMLSFTKPASPK